MIRVVCVVAVFAVMASALPAQASELRGRVVRAESGEPLALSVISVESTPIERFADDSGHFVIPNPPAFPFRLRVRHIGYTPREIEVVSDSALIVALDRVAVPLAAVRVEADRACVSPGAPTRDADPGLAAAFEQLEENASQYRLVTTSYPFIARMRRRFFYETGAGMEASSDDIVPIRSDAAWKYAPGEVVRRTPTGYAVNVPTLAVFADPGFVAAHCFWSGGLAGDSARLLAIRFRTAERIDSPDLDGTIYLDPTSYMIRRSVVRLSRISREIDQYDSVEVVTRFEELLPGVPIVTAVDGRDHYAGSGNGTTTARRALVETQRVLSLQFVRGIPGGNARRTTAPSPIVLDRVIGVFDEATGNPIANALLEDRLSGQTAKTTATGTARLGFVLDDHAQIQVSAPGFVSAMVAAELSLRPLPPITVVLRRAGR